MLVPNSFPVRFRGIWKAAQVRSAEGNFHLLQTGICMSSRKGVTPQVKVAVDDALQIWLSIQDCCEFGLKEKLISLAEDSASGHLFYSVCACV